LPVNIAQVFALINTSASGGSDLATTWKVGVLAGATTRYVESVSCTEADQPKLTRLEGGVIGDVRSTTWSESRS
jgi:hypothetical protein